MSTDDDPILAALRKLAGKVDAAPVMLWGTVSQASPLMVMLDGAIDPTGAPVAVPAQSAAGPVKVGQRVYCVRQSRRVIVVETPATDWLTLPLAPGFEAFDPARIPQYRIDRGMQMLSGLIKATTGQIANGATIATLVVAPARVHLQPSASSVTGVKPALVFNVNKTVVLSHTTSVDNVYLDGISFRV